eukprot:COSAG01_NODE_96_length_26789_cov_36.697089_31_plen_70_part_00
MLCGGKFGPQALQLRSHLVDRKERLSTIRLGHETAAGRLGGWCIGHVGQTFPDLLNDVIDVLVKITLVE